MPSETPQTAPADVTSLNSLGLSDVGIEINLISDHLSSYSPLISSIDSSSISPADRTNIQILESAHVIDHGLRQLVFPTDLLDLSLSSIDGWPTTIGTNHGEESSSDPEISLTTPGNNGISEFKIEENTNFDDTVIYSNELGESFLFPDIPVNDTESGEALYPFEDILPGETEGVQDVANDMSPLIDDLPTYYTEFLPTPVTPYDESQSGKSHSNAFWNI